MQKITPFLWYEDKAEEAANHYISIFKNSKIISINRYGESGSEVSGISEGKVMSVVFQIEGQEFMALNGGPVFSFNPAISFFVDCDSQEEVDQLWEKLSEGGEEGQCGWLTDKYGVSWQIVPNVLAKLMSDVDAAKSENVVKAMLQMKKLDINALKAAYEK